MSYYCKGRNALTVTKIILPNLLLHTITIFILIFNTKFNLKVFIILILSNETTTHFIKFNLLF